MALQGPGRLTRPSRPALWWAPWALVFLRAACGPVLLLIAWRSWFWSPAACAVLLAVGVLSDIFDGVVARRIGSVTDRLRTFDSRTDLVFWLCVTAGVLVLHPNLLASTWPVIVILGAMELTTHMVSYARFRREASPHHLLSKLFGLALWALLTRMLLTGDGGWLQWASFALGVASQLEAFAITLLLPEWRCDVSGVRAALRFRRAAAGTALRG